MIKRILILLAASFLAFCFYDAFPHAPQTSVLKLRLKVNAAGVPTAVLWDYDFTNPLNKPCSTATQATCVISFTVSTLEVFSGNPPPPPLAIGTPTTLSVLAMLPASTTGPTVGISVPYISPTAFGWYQIGVQVNFNDAAGKTQGGPISAISNYVGPTAVMNVRTTP